MGLFNIFKRNLGNNTENINNDEIPDGVYSIAEFNGKKLEVIEKHIRL